MEEELDSSFKAAAQNCEICYNSKEKSNMAFAQKCLKNIMDSYDKKDKNWKLAYELLGDCNKCDFRDPKIKNNLETYNISI